MNKKQKFVLWIAVGVISLLALFPPWVYQYYMDRAPQPRGIHFILSGPEHCRTNYTQPSLQSVFVILIAGGMVLALKDKD
ncbi:MAG: hypothetical protein DRJ65_22330 [Acidobacteria bacterium]|nr:MAG: hypothetical protein DRJ65_22330 [Acidobacteriota bacterium]